MCDNCGASIKLIMIEAKRQKELQQCYDMGFYDCTSCGNGGEYWGKEFISCPKCQKQWCEKCSPDFVYDCSHNRICSCSESNQTLKCEICRNYFCDECQLPECENCKISGTLNDNSERCPYCQKRIIYNDKNLCECCYQISC